MPGMFYIFFEGLLLGVWLIAYATSNIRGLVLVRWMIYTTIAVRVVSFFIHAAQADWGTLIATLVGALLWAGPCLRYINRDIARVQERVIDKNFTEIVKRTWN